MPTQTEVIVTDEEYEAYEAEQGQAVAAARAKMERETPKLRVNHGKRPGQDWRRKRPEGGGKTLVEAVQAGLRSPRFCSRLLEVEVWRGVPGR